MYHSTKLGRVAVTQFNNKLTSILRPTTLLFPNLFPFDEGFAFFFH